MMPLNLPFGRISSSRGTRGTIRKKRGRGYLNSLYCGNEFEMKNLYTMIFCIFCFIFGFSLGKVMYGNPKLDLIVPKNKYRTTFTGKLGVTKEEVLTRQGKPTTVFNNVWLYNHSSVIFDKQGRVRAWCNLDGSLKVY